ncbi:hypothetical protein MBLNU457_g0291t1 [Dothideomycetes sp. NU457]
MAPSLSLDTTSDMDLTPNQTRTLLLAPPSISSHPSALDAIFQSHDRSATDIQMLDRLALGLVSLPASTYDLILILTDASGSTTESDGLLDRGVLSRLVSALKTGGRLQAQNGGIAQGVITEGILAGLVQESSGAGLSKPTASTGAVKLSFGNRKKKADAAAVPLNATEAANKESIAATGTANGAAAGTKRPLGVGFVDFSDDFGYNDGEEYIPSKAELMDDDDIIDPDSLLTEEDRLRPVNIPEACKPNSKRRRACKDCSCGLREKLAAEDAATRAAADKNLQTMKLGADDLTEVDFTVQGKVGSCGNCALGDAFRCDGCPYIGLPAFKPGEEVRLLSNDVQL